MKTKERLAVALEKAGAPLWMIDKAKAGGYDDFESESAHPINDLVRDLDPISKDNPALHALRDGAITGEYDATEEESDAWAKSMENDPQTGPMLKKLGLL